MNRSTFPNDRRGFALLVALFAITLITALILATGLRTEQSATVANTEAVAYRALAAAEFALWQTVTTTDIQALEAEPIGATITSTTTTPTGTTRMWITRTDTTIVWLTVVTDIKHGVAAAHHRLGLSATIARASFGLTLRPIPGRAWVDLF